MRAFWSGAALRPSSRASRLNRSRALAAYQNEDGGFGSALEPDCRDPGSQPVAVQVALEMLDQMGAFHRHMALRACDWLQSVSRPEGGLPFALATANDYPHPLVAGCGG